MIKFAVSHPRSVSDGMWKAVPPLPLPTQPSQQPPHLELDKHPSLLQKVAISLVEEKETGSPQTLNVCHFVYLCTFLFFFILFCFVHFHSKIKTLGVLLSLISFSVFIFSYFYLQNYHIIFDPFSFFKDLYKKQFVIQIFENTKQIRKVSVLYLKVKIENVFLGNASQPLSKHFLLALNFLLNHLFCVMSSCGAGTMK